MLRGGLPDPSLAPVSVGVERAQAEIYAGVVAEVAIVGAGRVGVACAGSVLRQGLASRLVFYDRNADRALGEALDFQDAAPLLPDCAVEGRPLTEAAPADIAVITAGAPPEPGASRMTIIDHNLEVAAELADALAGALPRVAIVISNPVDVLTEFFTRAWAPRGVNVFGTGTALDSWRLRELLAARLGIHSGSVHAWVIGEHGLSAVFPFSLARIGPFPLREFAARNGRSIDTAAIAEEVRRAGPHVHELKGSTSSAIALTAARLVSHVLREHGAIVPVSVRVGEGVCASLPAELGPDGAGPGMMPELEEAELQAWEASLGVLREAAGRIDS
jgi:L-lactate dehydrogenase